jgi:GNAT superfamily N-acetyltransferase
MELTASVQRALVEGGVKTVFTRSLKKLARPVFSMGTLVFTECDLTKPFPDERPVNGIVIREATVDDVRLFEDRKLFLERITNGRRCFVGIEAETGELTNYRWFSTTPAYIPELDRYVWLKPGEVYAYDLKTLPEFRRRGIDAFSRCHAYRYFRDIGYRRVFAYIRADNFPSLHSSRHLLKPIGRVRYLQVRGWKPWMFGERGSALPELRKMDPRIQLPKN